MKPPAQSVRDRCSAVVALDRRAKAIREATGCSLAESYELAIDGEDESGSNPRGEAA